MLSGWSSSGTIAHVELSFHICLWSSLHSLIFFLIRCELTYSRPRAAVSLSKQRVVWEPKQGGPGSRGRWPFDSGHIRSGIQISIILKSVTTHPRKQGHCQTQPLSQRHHPFKSAHWTRPDCQIVKARSALESRVWMYLRLQPNKTEFNLKFELGQLTQAQSLAVLCFKIRIVNTLSKPCELSNSGLQEKDGNCKEDS